MRTVKILLIVVLAAVLALYAWTAVSQQMSGGQEGPVITCPEEVLEISVKDDESALFAGMTARDAQDGDLTGKILFSGMSKLLSDHKAKVDFVVFDSDGNLDKATRQIRYADYTAPRFSIREPLIYHRGEAIALLDRIRVEDCIDGDITGMVRVSALTATSEPEISTVELQVTNSMGDTVRQTLPVVQMESYAVRPEVKLTEYLVYLKKGASFNAKSYLGYVSTPEGVGDKSDVEITGTVDTSTPGTYLVRYTYPYETAPGTSVLTVVVEEGGSR